MTVETSLQRAADRDHGHEVAIVDPETTERIDEPGESGEIGAAHVANPAVADAGIIAVPDVEHGEVPSAFVVLEDGDAPSDGRRSELEGDVCDRLAESEYPRHVEFVDELPTTASGEVRRTALEERDGR